MDVGSILLLIGVGVVLCLVGIAAFGLILSTLGFAQFGLFSQMNRLRPRGRRSAGDK